MRGMSISVLPLALLLCGGLLSQQQQRQIEVEPTGMKDPVLVTQVTVNGNPVQCAVLQPAGPMGAASRGPIVPFGAPGADWLRKVDIYLFNRTNQTIAAGRITLMYPETKTASGPITLSNLDFGIVPDTILLNNGQPFPHRPDAQPISWGPGQTYVLHLADYTEGRGLDRLMPNGPGQVFVVKSDFFFASSLFWAVGAGYMVPDKQNPGKHKKVDSTFFPGLAYDNWPVPGHRFGQP